jgi:hypothetical protein
MEGWRRARRGRAGCGLARKQDALDDRTTIRFFIGRLSGIEPWNLRVAVVAGVDSLKLHRISENGWRTVYLFFTVPPAGSSQAGRSKAGQFVPKAAIEGLVGGDGA